MAENDKPEDLNKASETAPKMIEATESPKVNEEKVAPEHHEKGLPKSTSPAVSSSTSESGDAAALEKAEQPAGAEKSPRDVHGIKWAFAVVSILACTFLFVGLFSSLV